MNLRDLQSRRENIIRIAGKHGASNVRVFGSVARDETRRGSDVDFLIDLEDGRSLLDLAGLANDLEDLLDCPVDVGMERSLRPRLRERVLREAVLL